MRLRRTPGRICASACRCRARLAIEQDAAGNLYSVPTDYAHAVANYAGYEVQFVPSTWDDCRTQLADGTIDVVAGVLPGTAGTEGMAFGRMPLG